MIASKTDPDGSTPSKLNLTPDQMRVLGVERGPNPDCRWCKGSGEVFLVFSTVLCTDCWGEDQPTAPPTRDDLLGGRGQKKTDPESSPSPDVGPTTDSDEFLPEDVGSQETRTCNLCGRERGEIVVGNLTRRIYWQCGNCGKCRSKERSQ